jgi:hypothetical protein
MPQQGTPHGGDTCFGTLVVALPVLFRGGILKLSHDRESAQLAWDRALQPAGTSALDYRDMAGAAQRRAAHVPACGLQWAAFFGGVQHEVRAVWVGTAGCCQPQHTSADGALASRCSLLLCAAQVTAVHEGFRLTLTYTLHRDAPADATADVLLARASAFHSQLASALADADFMPEGGRTARRGQRRQLACPLTDIMMADT